MNENCLASGTQKEEFESKNLDHLGIVVGMIDDIGIVEKINDILLIDSREKINTGEVVRSFGEVKSQNSQEAQGIKIS